jgi:hypothetical protein
MGAHQQVEHPTSDLKDNSVSPIDQEKHLPSSSQQMSKLCPRHRLPSISTSEYGATSTTTKSYASRYSRRRLFTEPQQITETTQTNDESDVNPRQSKHKRNVSISSTQSTTETSMTTVQNENRNKKIFKRPRSRKFEHFYKLSRESKSSVNFKSQKMNEERQDMAVISNNVHFSLGPNPNQQTLKQQKEPTRLEILLQNYERSNTNRQNSNNNKKTELLNENLINVCDHEPFQVCDNCTSPKTIVNTFQTDDNNTSQNIDLESYLEKLEKNVFGDINY